MPDRAVFLDRDNTIIDAEDWVARPEDVRLIPEAADAIRRLRQAGYRIVVATNQSAVARGLIDEETLQAVHDHLKKLLADEGAPIDAVYYCPYLRGPDATVEAYRQDSELRKPRPGMLLQAGRDLDLDLFGSWSIGDSARDIEAGRAAGCRTVLICKDEVAEASESSGADFVVGSISEAADVVIANMDRAAAGGGARSGGRGLTMDQLTHRLDELINLLQRQQRSTIRGDFSFAKLAGAVVQMVALGVAFWGFMAMIDHQNSYAAVRFLLAIIVQLLALTLFVLHRQR